MQDLPFYLLASVFFELCVYFHDKRAANLTPLPYFEINLRRTELRLKWYSRCCVASSILALLLKAHEGII